MNPFLAPREPSVSPLSASQPPGVLHPGTVQCEAFLWFDWLDHAFTTRDSPDWAEQHQPITLRQIHSNSVANAKGLQNRQLEGDALISDESGKYIGIRTADCVPILIADSKNRAVAAIHAGWRGTVSGVTVEAVGRLMKDFGSDAANLHVAIGPSIRGCCYEVGPEVVSQLAPLFPEWLDRQNRRKVDLVEANRRMLVDAGVPDAQIHDCGHCTYCEPSRFFSYRRDPADPGRMVAAIARLS